MAKQTNPLDRFFRLVLGVSVVLAGAVGAAMGSRAFLGGASQRIWETRQCVVEDVHIGRNEPRGGVWFGGRYDVTFDLLELESGERFRGMPVSSSGPRYHDEYDVNRDVLPATPGALVDCWIDLTGRHAYLRRTPVFLLGFYVIGTLFSVAFALCGLMLLRPEVADRVGEYIEARFGNRFDLFY